MTTVNRAEMVKRRYELELEDRAVVIGFALVSDVAQSRSPDPEAAASKMASSAMDLIHKKMNGVLESSLTASTSG